MRKRLLGLRPRHALDLAGTWFRGGDHRPSEGVDWELGLGLHFLGQGAGHVEERLRLHTLCSSRCFQDQQQWCSSRGALAWEGGSDVLGDLLALVSTTLHAAHRQVGLEEHDSHGKEDRVNEQRDDEHAGHLRHVLGDAAVHVLGDFERVLRWRVEWRLVVLLVVGSSALTPAAGVLCSLGEELRKGQDHGRVHDHVHQDAAEDRNGCAKA
mmetsp:Transcript_1774/g.3975  ORF Transcript_1774/g.3975 Transcript_1774/m.3975 type:complete len:211 (-) Transcript_1774:1094-1726(-)